MLILPIQGKWFNMILSGEKDEEYREIRPYYISRFRNIFEMYPYTCFPYGTDRHEVMFRNGYRANSPSFIAECSLDVRPGRPEWGAEEGKDYFVLKIWRIKDRNLGKRRKTL